jgi:alkanesulfonate monooxygenase SsuD/methylene tetrahydromethanopterin reductase-like flavin-dependent oxidoreductase (luciferase family)
MHDGRRIKVTPKPYTPGGPLLLWGGGSLAAARRAGRYGLGFLAQANLPGMQEAYEGACRKNGHAPGFTLLLERDTPSACFVADDLDEAWAELGPYLLHDAKTYADWNPGNVTSAGITHVDTVDELRATSKSHRIFTVPEAIAQIGDMGMLNLSPLCGGVPPAIAWPYLERVANVVLPQAAGPPVTTTP